VIAIVLYIALALAGSRGSGNQIWAVVVVDDVCEGLDLQGNIPHGLGDGRFPRSGSLR